MCLGKLEFDYRELLHYVEWQNAAVNLTGVAPDNPGRNSDDTWIFRDIAVRVVSDQR